MKKNAILISLFIVLSLIAFYIKQNSISKSNLELIVAYESSNIFKEYVEELEKAKGANGENILEIKNVKESYEVKYGENLDKLNSVLEENIKKRKIIIYENEYFRQILYSSLFLFWLGVAFYIHRK